MVAMINGETLGSMCFVMMCLSPAPMALAARARKDILHVKRVLGHKNIKNTLVYTHLIDFREDERVSKVARNADEACELVEAGFDFVCSTPDNLMVFRKRK